jgi:A/G-specific adenine glycosylase
MHNQALMEFGALQCTPKKPDCPNCPLMENCLAFSSGKVGELPVKRNKTKQRDRYFNYLIFEWGNCTWLQQRVKNDIWMGLFEFPVVESSEKTGVHQIFTNTVWDKITNNSGITVGNVSNWKIHILSHQKIHYRFIKLNMSEEIEMPDALVRVNKEDILSFAVPKLLESFIDEWI